MNQPQLNNPSNAMNNIDFAHLIGSPLKAAVEAQTLSSHTTVQFIMEVGFEPIEIKNTEERNRMHEVERGTGDARKKYQLPKFELEKKDIEATPAPKPLYITPEGVVQTTSTDAKKYYLPNEDDSKRKARYVTFRYQSQGEENSQVEIEVPILTIVPIPFLSIKTMDLHFNARITGMYEDSESSSTKVTEYKSRSKSRGSGWWGRRSRSRSYSSRATISTNNSATESSESSELTMDIRIHAANESMPAGLSRVLGILESVISEKILPADADKK